MKYNQGDYVRIKTPRELTGLKIQNGSAIDKWKNKICTVEDVCYTPLGQRYKLALVEPAMPESENVCCGYRFGEYMWEEFELALAKPMTVREDAYEQLLGGVL